MAVSNRGEASFFQAFTPLPVEDGAAFRAANDGDREALAAIVSRKQYEFSATTSADENVTFDIPRASIGMDVSGVSRCVVRARYVQTGATAAGMQFGEAWAMFADIAGTLTLVGASVAPVFATGTANTVGTWSASTTNLRLTVDTGSGVTATHLVQVEVWKVA
jgi:hypothetical protein